MIDDWTLSASKLKTFDRCQEQFRLEYLEGYRDFGPENRYIRRGNAVHDAIEDALRLHDLDEIDSQLLKSAYRSRGGRVGYDLVEDDHDLVHDCLETAARFLAGLDEEVLGVEMEVEFGVDQSGITRDFGGFIDVATDRSVIDWKTGGDNGLDETLQGAVYMGGYAHEFGRPPERIVYAYLNPHKGDEFPKKREIDPSDDVWTTMLTHARNLLGSIETGEFDPTGLGEQCHWCDVEVFCEQSPVGAGGIDYEAYP